MEYREYNLPRNFSVNVILIHAEFKEVTGKENNICKSFRLNVTNKIIPTTFIYLQIHRTAENPYPRLPYALLIYSTMDIYIIWHFCFMSSSAS